MSSYHKNTGPAGRKDLSTSLASHAQRLENAHELGHTFAIMDTLAFDGQVALRNEESALSVWSRQGFGSDVERLGVTCAGPLVDMLGKGILVANMEPVEIEAALRQFLAAAADGGTVDDSACYERVAARLSPAGVTIAIGRGLEAAAKALTLAGRHPAFITWLGEAIDRTPSDQCLTFDKQACAILLDATSAEGRGLDHEALIVRREWFNNWLAAGDTKTLEAELLDDTLAVLAQMEARGEIVDGRLTPAGLARLDANGG
ncbi:hypothetical protein [Erythrobacter dokdonensis]|nr:hypothetical protein [Erythrobacter dokdonensis]